MCKKNAASNKSLANIQKIDRRLGIIFHDLAEIKQTFWPVIYLYHYGIKHANCLAVFTGYPYSLHSMDGNPRRSF